VTDDYNSGSTSAVQNDPVLFTDEKINKTMMSKDFKERLAPRDTPSPFESSPLTKWTTKYTENNVQDFVNNYSGLPSHHSFTSNKRRFFGENLQCSCTVSSLVVSSHNFSVRNKITSVEAAMEQ
jgi:hypothetical protein